MLVEDMLGSCVHDTAGSTSIALGLEDEKVDGGRKESGGIGRMCELKGHESVWWEERESEGEKETKRGGKASEEGRKEGRDDEQTREKRGERGKEKRREDEEKKAEE